MFLKLLIIHQIICIFYFMFPNSFETHNLEKNGKLINYYTLS